MLKSICLYTKYFTVSALTKWRRQLLMNELHRSGRKELMNAPCAGTEERNNALENAVNWLLHSRKMMKDNGFGSYHIINGWSSSYPETSGYIIPTLINYVKYSGRKKILNSARDAADWLIEIQKPNGAWQGGRIDENKPEIVFNTGQIIRGMIAAYNKFKDEKYLDSAIKAGNWLSKIQHPYGYWKKHALMQQERAYDSFVDAPLLELWKITGNEKYSDTALNNLEWITELKQLPNGWFVDCDNTIKRNDKPILHTIAYTIDGLLDCGHLLGSEKYIAAATKPADILFERFFTGAYLHGRYDEEWQGTEYMIPSACAQITIIWLKLAKITGLKEYFETATKMLDQLIYIRNRNNFDTENTKGALPGSFPPWGKYEPFAFPNWATKFFVDALLLEHSLSRTTSEWQDN